MVIKIALRTKGGFSRQVEGESDFVGKFCQSIPLFAVILDSKRSLFL